MDKRIEKTKKMLKQSLLDLLGQKPFQKVTVTEICENACTSRITFYTYYEDKYALVEDLSNDLRQEIQQTFEQLQAENNPSDEFILHHQNIVDAILDVEDRHDAMFSQISAQENVEAQYFYYQFILKSIENIELKYEQLNPRYPIRPLSAFVVAGVWEYIREAQRNSQPRKKTRREIRSLMTDLMHSDLFRSAKHS